MVRVTDPGNSGRIAGPAPQPPGLAATQKYGKGRGPAPRHTGSHGRLLSSFRTLIWNTIPADYPILLEPLIQGKADVVYGSRFLGSRPHRVLYFWHSVGNRLLTLLSNCLTNINLSDMETCYKVFRREIVQSIPLEEDRFGFEPEITVKIAKRRLRIYEVGISYWGRTYEEGKKIGWKDGVRCLWCLLKYSIKERAVTLPHSVDSEASALVTRQDQIGFRLGVLVCCPRNTWNDRNVSGAGRVG